MIFYILFGIPPMGKSGGELMKEKHINPQNFSTSHQITFDGEASLTVFIRAFRVLKVRQGQLVFGPIAHILMRHHTRARDRCSRFYLARAFVRVCKPDVGRLLFLCDTIAWLTRFGVSLCLSIDTHLSYLSRLFQS